MAEAIATVLSPVNLALVLLGSAIGIISGALPGVGASLTIALLLPFTYKMAAASALVFLMAVWAGDIFGGSISSILINTPGTGGNVATCFDGYPMAKAGRAGDALGISLISSFLGGTFSIFALMFLAPPIAELSLAFGPAAYFWLAVVGLSIIATASRGSTLKGLIAGGFGLMVSLIGYDVVTGFVRFDFGTLYLQDGVQFIPAMIGLFAISQILVMAGEPVGGQSQIGKVTGSVWRGVATALRHPFVLIRSALIGTVFGAIPAVGVGAASLVAYTETVRFSKDRESFGKGNPAGIVAPEAANNAVQGGALIPTLSLGIPGNATTAILLGALTIWGLRPGMELFSSSASIVHAVFAGLFLAQIAFFVLGILFSGTFAKVIQVPKRVLIPCILLTCFTGAYAMRADIADVIVMLIFGVIGYGMRRQGYPMVCTVLAMILGPLMERNFSRALLISGGSYGIFFRGTLCWIMIGLLLVSLAFGILPELRSRGKATSGSKAA
ncbi:MAG: tripartite tricarboxylate transporter permease [Firmicutes bacterium]|nr:tripartite tricarboxylate transporter permease [Bacillota bacterium]